MAVGSANHDGLQFAHPNLQSVFKNPDTMLAALASVTGSRGLGRVIPVDHAEVQLLNIDKLLFTGLG
jgi:hypothetical protein